MTMFVVYQKLSQKEAREVFVQLKEWFSTHPKRKVCNTEFGKVRRSHMTEDFLRFCVDGTKLED